MKNSNRITYALQFVFIFVFYFITAKVGLSLGEVSKYATSVWPPAGISLIAVLVYGYRILPAIFLAAFTVNFSVAGSLPIALGTGCGNMLEAYLAVFLLKKFIPDFSHQLNRLKDVLGLVFFGGVISTLVSASFGVGSLLAFGAIDQVAPSLVWRTWWIGDLLGDLITGSFLMVYFSGWRLKFKPIQWLEKLVLVCLVFITIYFAYHRNLNPSNHRYPTSYAVFPFIIWAALRFEQIGTVTTVLLISIITIYYTAKGVGPYAGENPADSFLYLQTFQGVLAFSGMIIASVMMEKKELYQQAQQAVRAREDFLSIASHELRTPITLLHMNLQRIQRLISKATPSEDYRKEILQSVESSKISSSHLVSMVDSLLDVAHVRAGNLSINREETNLSVVAKNVVDRFSDFAHQFETPIRLEIMNEKTLGMWDRDRIEQVLSNLISNAIKYGNKKTIDIFIIDRPEKDQAEIIVKDMGIGIPKEMQMKIFERFERAVGYSNISGLGLGLYIVRQIVEAHGGIITVESEPKTGSCFTVILPKSGNVPVKK